MYTRTYTKPSRKYTPPPGYDGNAFPEPDAPSVKYHEAEETLPRREPSAPEEPLSETEIPTAETFDLFAEPLPKETEPPHPALQSLEALFRHLRGRFGREELILVLVMLLISSEANVELLLLALLLVVG